MTKKALMFTFGQTLENHAVGEALHVPNPNPRSPAFALQESFRLVNEAGLISHTWELKTSISDKIDEVIRDKVTWNERDCHWQIGKGKNVAFKEIAQTALRWYVHDWDFQRHTRDTEVEYPEDFGRLLFDSEFKHLSACLLPAKDELTRRILKSPNHNSCFYYVDVVPQDNNQFTAEFGRFDKPEYHRTLGQSKDFWRLEVDTVLPQLEAGTVLSYTVHHISSKKGV
jgi:hypothetical protein